MLSDKFKKENTLLFIFIIGIAILIIVALILFFIVGNKTGVSFLIGA